MEDVCTGTVVKDHIMSAFIHAVPDVINLILKRISDEDLEKLKKN